MIWSLYWIPMGWFRFKLYR